MGEDKEKELNEEEADKVVGGCFFTKARPSIGKGLGANVTSYKPGYR